MNLGLMLASAPVSHFCFVIAVQHFQVRADAFDEKVLPAAMELLPLHVRVNVRLE